MKRRVRKSWTWLSGAGGGSRECSASLRTAQIAAMSVRDVRPLADDAVVGRRTRPRCGGSSGSDYPPGFLLSPVVRMSRSSARCVRGGMTSDTGRFLRRSSRLNSYLWAPAVTCPSGRNTARCGFWPGRSAVMNTTVECFSLSFPFPASRLPPADRSSMRVALPSVWAVAVPLALEVSTGTPDRYGT